MSTKRAILSVFAVLVLASLVAGIPLAGGPGSAIYMDHRRADVIGYTWKNTGPVSNGLTIEYWLYIVDVFQEESLTFSYVHTLCNALHGASGPIERKNAR
jgi:hypothetical protein